MVKYTLFKNKLSTSAIAPYLPKTLLEGTLSFEQFIKALAYGSTATAADVKAVLENIERVCIEHLSQGRSVNLGFCTIRPKEVSRILRIALLLRRIGLKYLSRQIQLSKRKSLSKLNSKG